MLELKWKMRSILLVALETLHWRRKAAGSGKHQAERSIGSTRREREQLIGSESRPRLTNSSFSNRRLTMQYVGNVHFRICIHQKNVDWSIGICCLSLRGLFQVEAKAGHSVPTQWLDLRSWGSAEGSSVITEIPTTKERRWKGSYLTRCPTQQRED